MSIRQILYKMVIQLASSSQKNYDNSTGTKQRKEDTRNKSGSRSMSSIYNSVALLALYVLDTALLIILLPFMICQSISASDRVKTVLKAAVEISLELIMGIIFAGVSIAMTTTFVLEEIFCAKSDHYKLKQLMNLEHVSTTSKNEAQNVSEDQDKLKVPNNSC